MLSFLRRVDFLEFASASGLLCFAQVSTTVGIDSVISSLQLVKKGLNIK
jgi:hypothetical protein